MVYSVRWVSDWFSWIGGDESLRMLSPRSLYVLLDAGFDRKALVGKIAAESLAPREGLPQGEPLPAVTHRVCMLLLFSRGIL